MHSHLQSQSGVVDDFAPDWDFDEGRGELGSALTDLLLAITSDDERTCDDGFHSPGLHSDGINVWVCTKVGNNNVAREQNTRMDGNENDARRAFKPLRNTPLTCDLCIRLVTI